MDATPLGLVIGPTSKPNPPVLGSDVRLLPARTKVSSTVSVSVLRVTVSPCTTKSPPTYRSLLIPTPPATVRAPVVLLVEFVVLNTFAVAGILKSLGIPRVTDLTSPVLPLSTI